MAQKAKSQWQLYTNQELSAGAKHWGLTIEQERQRLRLVQSDFRLWPSDLLTMLRQKHSGGLELVGFTMIQYSVVNWLKQGNVVPAEVEDEMASAVAA